MKKHITILLALTLLAALLSACGGDVAGNSGVPESSGSDDTVYTLTVSSPKNENAEAAMVQWMEELTEKSNGRLQFDIHLSNALYQQSEVISALNSGMLDIADISLSEEPNTFALNSNIISLPFMGMSFENDWIYQTLLDEFPELTAEYDNAGVVLIDYAYNPPFNMHFITDDPITVPSDLNGLKIVTTSDILSSFIAEQGGAPVNQPITEWYNSLEKGVATGLVAHANNIYNFGIVELLRQDVIFGEGSGITTNLNAYIWSKESWEALPEDLQQLVLDTVPDFHANNIATMESQVADADAACEENGNLITVLTDEELVVWRDAASGLVEEKIAELEADTGAPVTEMYQRALELAAGE